MPRNRSEDKVEVLVKLVGLGLLLLALYFCGTRGLAGMAMMLRTLMVWLLVGAILIGAGYLLVRYVRRRRTASDGMPDASAPVSSMVAWTDERVSTSLHSIDWYQFEKLVAALLVAEGWAVARKGGATPDGGVDLIATKAERRMLIQCKHWKTWKVQERVIRELLGSMTHFSVSEGAIYTLAGWTQPAAGFAAQHGIHLADQHELTTRFRAKLTEEELGRWLNPKEHHCPRCEALMVWRTGDFKPFWGCSTFPKCRGVLRET